MAPHTKRIARRFGAGSDTGPEIVSRRVLSFAMSQSGLRAVRAWCVLLTWSGTATAQQDVPQSPTEIHEHVAVGAPLLTPTRDASGSGWLPPATPMFGLHEPWRGWDLRLDGVVVGQLVVEPGERHRTGGASARQVVGLNWGMAMARRRLAGGRFGVRTMLSAEPWTVSRCGTIGFLNTGEVCNGDSVHDRQPPHDLVMELAADYERRVRGQWRWQVYGGLAGEPALGPPGYPHRTSARMNPIGPLTHHWLDSTHVTFGLVTAGLHNQRWKMEASAFNGRAPDESRADVDLGRFDSVAARLSFLPTTRLALQLSAGRLRDALTDFPAQSQEPFTRVTASAIYHRPAGSERVWATTVAVGANDAREEVAGGVLDATTFGALVESSLKRARSTIFGRAELGGMPAHHLHAHENPTLVVPIGKVQVGYVRQMSPWRSVALGVGGTVALSVLPLALSPRYGGRTAPSFALFLNLSAAEHKM